MPAGKNSAMIKPETPMVRAQTAFQSEVLFFISIQSQSVRLVLDSMVIGRCSLLEDFQSCYGVSHIGSTHADYLTWRTPSLAILRLLSQSCGKLKRDPELRRRDAHHSPKDLREMARAGVAHFESDIDETARSFADQLLGVGNSLACYEL